MAHATEIVRDEVDAKPIAVSLADFASALTFDDLPAPVVERAKLHILDALGIALAASRYDYSHKTLTAIRGLAGEGEFPIVGMAAGLPYRDAAVMNGFLIHSLDYDDTHVAGVIHATASAVPVLLAAGQRHGASGKAALAAYVAAIETSARIGMAAKGGFHKKGFHPTGLVGAFGAAIAAGRLSGLTASQIAHAQGVVYSMAAGNLEFLEEGAWTKRLHPGWAAASGITAAALAQQGFAGPSAPYEGRFGLYATCTGDDTPIDVDLATHDLGSDWEMLRVGIKPYPACHLTHACADAARALVAEHGLTPERIERITARVAGDCMPVVCEPLAEKQRPQSGYEAQFSLPYVVASAILRDGLTLGDLEADAYADGRALALCDKVICEPMAGSSYPTYFSGEVEILTSDGETLTHREQVNRGADERPLSAEEIIGKYRDNAALALSSERVEQALEAVMGLEEDASDPAAIARLLSHA